MIKLRIGSTWSQRSLLEARVKPGDLLFARRSFVLERGREVFDYR